MAEIELSTAEEQYFARLEKRVQDALPQFVDACAALIEIRDRKLYRGISSSFEKYCQIRWQFSRRQADRLIASGVILKELKSDENGAKVLPSSEQQTRPLARLATPRARRAAWKEAVETAPKSSNGQPRVSGAHVERVVARRVEPESEKPDESSDVADHTGQKLGKRAKLVAIFRDDDLVLEVERLLTATKKAKNVLIESPAGVAIKSQSSQIDSFLDQVRSIVRLYQFHAVCPECDGKGCTACAKIGAITRDTFDRIKKADEIRSK